MTLNPFAGSTGTIAASATPWWSNVGSALSKNSNLLLGIGGELLGGNLGGIGQAAAVGSQADSAYSASKKADKDRQAALNATQKVLARFPDLQALAVPGADTGPLISEAFKRMSPDYAAKGAGAADPADVATYKFYANQELQAGRNPKSFADWTAGTRPGIKGSLGPTMSYVDPVTKQIHPVQKFTDGSTIDLLTQQPPDPSLTFDPSAQAQAQAAGQAFGTAQGGMQFNMPAAKQNIDTELANIEAIKNDKSGGLDQKFGNVGGVSVLGVGIPNQWTPTIPNTPRAAVEARVSQVVGENFLQAYASLKGAGAITEVEGAKAQDAMARLSAAQSKADFMQALNDLEDVLKTGYARMGTQAGGNFQSNGYQPPALGAGGAPPAAGGAGGFKVLSVTP